MRDIWSDFRYSLRMLLKHPGFVAVGLVSLVLGIGANATIFTLVYALLFRPVTDLDPAGLVSIYTSFEDGSDFSVSSYPDLLDLQERDDTFSGVAGFFYIPVSARGQGDPGIVLGATVSRNYFELLGVEAFLGRTFTSLTDSSENAVAVLSHQFWKNNYGSDLSVIGKRVLVNSQPLTIIGVAPDGFTSTWIAFSPDVWIPLEMAGYVLPLELDIDNRETRWLKMVGRLNPGITVDQAQAAAAQLAESLGKEYPDSNEEMDFTVTAVQRLPGNITQSLQALSALLMVTVGLVLCIACSNVANLFLVRVMGRRREMAIRYALGGNRLRIIRQLMIESVTLSLAAGVLALWISSWLTQLFSVVNTTTDWPTHFEVGVDWRIMIFTIILSLLTGIVLGLVPVFRTYTSDLYTSLKDQPAFSRNPSRSWTQGVLVTGQLALTLILLISSGLCLKSFYKLLEVDPGYDVNNILVASFDLNYSNYDETSARSFFTRLKEEVNSYPGIQTSSLAYVAPLPTGSDTFGVSIQGYIPAPEEKMTFYGNRVDEQYFETLGLDVIRGRPFDHRDNAEGQPVIVINQTMAKRFWPEGDPIGDIVRTRETDFRVIGIVEDAKYRYIDEDPEPYLYLSLTQRQISMVSLHVRTIGSPETMSGTVQKIFRHLDPNLPIEIRTMSERVGGNLWPHKLITGVIGIFGFLALSLALIGVYGVVSYTSRQRVYEMGIRSALGATQGELLKLAMRKAICMIGVGLGLGLFGAFLTSRLLANFLYQTTAMEPLVFIAVAIGMAVVALIASLLPARNAARVDPIIAIRNL